MSEPAPATVRGLIERQATLRPDAVYARATESRKSSASVQVSPVCCTIPPSMPES